MFNTTWKWYIAIYASLAVSVVLNYYAYELAKIGTICVCHGVEAYKNGLRIESLGGPFKLSDGTSPDFDSFMWMILYFSLFFIACSPVIITYKLMVRYGWKDKFSEMETSAREAE